MIRKTLLVLFVMTACVFAATAQAGYKKYDIKSGIITYAEVIKVSTMTINNKYIVYFDDYGMKECRETWSADNKLTGVNFSDLKDEWSLNPNKKKAVRQGDGGRGTEIRADWTEFGTEKDRQSGKIKMLPARTIAGKICEVFQTGSDKSPTVYAGYKKILMLLDTKSSSTHVVRTAVKIEENVPVPADKFTVPAGYSK
jgi:hypothetical protein